MIIYHVYNRGAHKQPVFHDDHDYRRYQLLLKVCNSLDAVHVQKLKQIAGYSLPELFALDVGTPLVHILAYCLMENHLHLVIACDQTADLSKLLQKVNTGYTMYYNEKYGHSGVVFQGKTKKKQVTSDAYYRWIFSYVHLNPLSIIDTAWDSKVRTVTNRALAKKFLTNYLWSSYVDHWLKHQRPESSILSLSEAPDFLKKIDDFEDLVDEAKEEPAE